ncbi:MAG: response regulator [Planctomycetota bacterium]|nr:response regulator [Planctomycetota bacterium]
MMPSPRQPDEPQNPATGGHAGCRLNLLLSSGGWQSDPWVERLPRLLEPMGVRSHQATTGAEATRIIQSTPIHVAVVDLALPLDTGADSDPELQEGGPRLLEILVRLASPPPVVVIKRRRTLRDEARDIAAALRMGAFAVVDRPREAQDLNVMLEVLRRCLERHYRGKWPV